MGDSKKKLVPRNCKKKTLFVLNNLTDELLHEILIRLPSNKEAIRCKSVCKRWFSLISSDYFVTASTIHHRDNDKTRIPFTLLVMRDRTSLEYVEFLNAKGLSRRTLDLGFLFAGLPNDRSFSLDASCGDLILLRLGGNYFDRDYSVMKYYYICNIVTRQWIALPPAPPGRGRFGESVGFLYEPLDNDDRHNKYLVLRFIPCGWYHQEGNSRFDVQIFSSDTGRWTASLVMSPRILNTSSSDETSMIACGRMLYTLNYRNDVTVNCIIVFDPFTNDPARLLHVIDLPLEARDVCCLDNKLGVCRGRLQFAHLSLQQNRYPCISVWELEDYRMGIWTLVHKRIPTSLPLRTRLSCHDTVNYISVLAFHPYNEDLMCFLVSKNLVVVYNIRTDKVESSTHNSLFMLQDPPRLLVPGVLPLTQQWWPTPVRAIPLVSYSSYRRVSLAHLD